MPTQWPQLVVMKLNRNPSRWFQIPPPGSTLTEVLMSMCVALITIGGCIQGYLHAANQAEKSAYSLAAQSLASQGLEQVRAAKWDLVATPPVDQVVPTNFPAMVSVLDVPVAGTNSVYATNFTTITAVSTTPPLRLVQVDCVWQFMERGVFTNTVVSYRAPDQ